MPKSTSSIPPRDLEVTLDARSPIPLYLQLKHHMVHLISAGLWTPGMPVPSVRHLASQLGLATATVQRAYSELQTQGMLVGQVGRGVYVSELAAGVPDLHGERSEVLNAVLARAVAHAHSLGFREDEIVASVRDLVGGHKGGRPAPHVVFLGAGPEFVNKYTPFLGAALSDLHVDVDGASMDELIATGDAALDRLEPIICLVSLVGTFAELRRLAGHRGTPIFGLVVDLMEDTQHALMHLPTDAPLAIIAEDHYMPSARSLVLEYRGNEENVLVVRHSNRAGLARALREDRVIIHTFGSKRLFERYLKPTTRQIELRYEPNSASLARLRTLLTGLLSQRAQASEEAQRLVHAV